VVSALYRYQEALEASLITPADIGLRDVVAARENSISDSSQVDLNILCPDIDQHDFETTNSRINHHLQIGVARESGFNGEGFGTADVLFSGVENMPC